MDLNSETVPAYINQLTIEENKRLQKELDETKLALIRRGKENELLKQALKVYQEEMQTGTKMGLHMNNIRHSSGC